MPQLCLHLLPAAQSSVNEVERIARQVGFCLFRFSILDQGGDFGFYERHLVGRFLLEGENGRLDQFTAMPPADLRKAIRPPVGPKSGIGAITFMSAYLEAFRHVGHACKQGNTRALARIVFRPPADASHLIRQPVAALDHKRIGTPDDRNRALFPYLLILRRCAFRKSNISFVIQFCANGLL